MTTKTFHFVVLFIWRHMSNRRNAARTEKQQRKLEEGTVISPFPKVKKISINMIYTQKGLGTPLQRTLNYLPESNAYFIVECLSKTCVEGGFDLSRFINTMVRGNKKTADGQLNCCSANSADCLSAINYKVAIKY
jgi:hypothetical protein